MCEFCPSTGGYCAVCDHYAKQNAVTVADGMTDADYRQLFDLIDRLTNDERFSKLRYKATEMRAKAAAFEQDTALEEFVSYFRK